MSKFTLDIRRLDEVIDYLHEYAQRAAYGCLGALFVMKANEVPLYLKIHSHKYSWVTGRNTRRPTKYRDDQIDPRLLDILRLEGDADRSKGFKAKLRHPVYKKPEQLIKFLQKKGFQF